MICTLQRKMLCMINDKFLKQLLLHMHAVNERFQISRVY